MTREGRTGEMRDEGRGMRDDGLSGRRVAREYMYSISSSKAESTTEVAPAIRQSM